MPGALLFLGSLSAQSQVIRLETRLTICACGFLMRPLSFLLITHSLSHGFTVKAGGGGAGIKKNGRHCHLFLLRHSMILALGEPVQNNSGQLVGPRVSDSSGKITSFKGHMMPGPAICLPKDEVTEAPAARQRQSAMGPFEILIEAFSLLIIRTRPH